MWIGLNPSTADELNDDQTLRKCMGFTKRWGYLRMVMTNLFAFRATDPADMKKEADPVGPDNLHYLRILSGQSDLIVAAWGVNGKHLGQDWQVVKAIGDAKPIMCLRGTDNNFPEHPLYVPYGITPKLFIA